MREIKVSCIAFAYSCLRHTEGKSHVLIDAVANFLESGNTFLIILNDSPHAGSEAVVEGLNLCGKRNVVICSATRGGWQIYDVNTSTHEQINGTQSMESMLDEIQNKHQIPKQATLTVGAKDSHLVLKRCSALHFHVGEQEELTKKIRGLIPLTEQYELGLSNVLKYFATNNHLDRVIDYLDLINFVGNSRDFFRSDSAALLLSKKHASASVELMKRFPDDISAIFGTGFPFYMLDDGRVSQCAKTPESIIKYFDIQYGYFKSKIVDEQTFVINANQKYSAQEMSEKFGLNVLRNEFDCYKYEMMNHPPPTPVSGDMSFEDYYANTCFEIETDMWPCHYCVTLQSEERFPNQVKLKNTNVTCLPCKQTSFMLRNVMSCTPDIDMVVVVKKDKAFHAERIKDYITRDSSYHIYDSDFQKTVMENDGPIDLFVTEVGELSNAFHNLLERDWTDTSFDSIALWLPSVHYQGQLGLCFPLAFEPIVIKDENLLRDFVNTRIAFAKRYSAQQVVGELTQASFYTKQLMSNTSIVDFLTKRLADWRGSVKHL